MSFCDQMAAAIDGARTLTRLDHLSRSIWQGVTAGAVADDDAQALPSASTPAGASYAAISSRWAFHPAGRRSSRPGGCKGLPSARWRSPAAAPGRLGSDAAALACKFTVGELAVLRIVGDEVRQHGHCDRC